MHQSESRQLHYDSDLGELQDLLGRLGLAGLTKLVSLMSLAFKPDSASKAFVSISSDTLLMRLMMSFTVNL